MGGTEHQQDEPKQPDANASEKDGKKGAVPPVRSAADEAEEKHRKATQGKPNDTGPGQANPNESG